MTRVARLGGLLIVGVAVAVGLAGLIGYAASAYTVGTGMVTIGGTKTKVLTDPKDMTLYYFAADPATHSACTGGCAKLWLALTSASAPTSEDPVPGKLAVVKTDNGPQVAYNGHLLYTYSGDTKPGQASGQGLAGKWWVAAVDLKAATSTTSTTNGGTSTTSSGW